MATRLPQTPRTALEEILADADLDVLGRDDFLPRNRALQAEVSALGRPVGDKPWLTGQTQFLQSHRYWTAAARSLRDRGKERNIDLLERLLADNASM
jgi:uncharacterized protein